MKAILINYNDLTIKSKDSLKKSMNDFNAKPIIEIQETKTGYKFNYE